MCRTEKWAVLCTAVMILFCAGMRLVSYVSEQNANAETQVLRAYICLPRDNSSLLPGYNYHLLRLMAQQTGMVPEIKLERHSNVRLADLTEKNADLIVLPLADSSLAAGEFCAVNVDSASLWVILKTQKNLVRNVQKFIEGFLQSDEYARTHYIYTKTYDPFRGAKRKTLSPYDDIIRHQADSLGWDWRMLAAIVYQESHFHIEAGSEKGARGLMQLIPETGRRFGAGDLTDPEQNIMAGGRYLRHLQRQFKKVSASGEEHVKLTLAAYNAGAGRIHDCITTAQSKGVNPGYWENLTSVIPSMRNRSILDSLDLRCGTFQGYETIAYVDRVLATYREFCRMCPEQ